MVVIPHITVIQWTIWFLSIALHLTICVMMVRRKLARAYPCFFAYTAYHAAHSIAGYFLFHFSKEAYFCSYWGGEIADAILTLAVIQEIFRVTFAPYEALRRFGLTIFNWVATGLCAVVLVTAVIAPAGEMDRLMSALFVLDRSVQLVELGLVVLLFAFCRVFGMGWRNYGFGIAIGMTVITSIGTVAFSIRTWVGQSGNDWFVLVAPLGFTLGTIVFAYYFASVKSVIPLEQVPRTEQLIAWNLALSRLGGKNVS
jgi:hypothetical protein